VGAQIGSHETEVGWLPPGTSLEFLLRPLGWPESRSGQGVEIRWGQRRVPGRLSEFGVAEVLEIRECVVQPPAR
jgi:hypothetical protein